ncbi:DUF3152 domain-containing protein [Streptomyces sp. AS58]|uniref:DUF3152 domain-containing protein n=1 Tax=Streptomyces sp. AS58 TaxID=1519489 RepID=UPI0006B052BF|nr:DUF3152 domain-containing protein [Streptomyces sp. AS58]
MGRHSRRGPAPKGEAAEKGARRRTPGPSGSRQAPTGGAGAGHGVPRRAAGPAAPGTPLTADGMPTGQVPRPAEGPAGYGVPRFVDGTPAHGFPRLPDGTPARGVPRLPDGSVPGGVPRFVEGTLAPGVPRLPDGTPARGVPRLPDGSVPGGVPRFVDGTPAHGVPRLPDGTPAHGFPRVADGTPAHGIPQVRGGHPEQRERGGGWGESGGRPGGGPEVAPGAGIPGQRRTTRGPRQEYVDAFEENENLFAPRGQTSAALAPDPYASVTSWDVRPAPDLDDAPPTGEPAPARSGKGRAFTGIAAAAVTTVLAVVVAGQVADGSDDAEVQSRAAVDQDRDQEQDRDTRDSASRGDGRPTRSASPGAVPLTYDQKMAKTYPLSAKLDGSGKFDAVAGVDKAPGRGQKFTYRVDVEKGLGLDAELFADAVQQTLNDDRSWAHDGARTFERIHSGSPDFVITLASPGTTADWCSRSGLDTTIDNVSCDSASTERVMINAYRWAQGSETYGDKIHAYRQMLINHEIGHRLGYSHVTCDKDGDLAPVMQQQTKFLEHDGIRCKANPWPYPGS